MAWGSAFRTILAVTGALVGIILPHLATAQSFDIFVIDPDTDELILLEPVQGAGVNRSIIGPVGFNQIMGLTYDPVRDVLFGADQASGQLVSIDQETGQGTAIGPIGLTNDRGGIGFEIDDLTFGPDNRLLALMTGLSTGGQVFSRIVEIDPATGQGTLLQQLGGVRGAMAYQPRTQQLVTTTEWFQSGGTFYEVNLSTGQETALVSGNRFGTRSLAPDPASDSVLGILKGHGTGPAVLMEYLLASPFSVDSIGEIKRANNDNPGWVLATASASTPPYPGTISGIVSVSSGRRAVFAQVSASPGTATTRTDGSGAFSLSVPAGTYSVTATAIGYTGDTIEDVEVLTNTESEASLSLISPNRKAVGNLRMFARRVLTDAFNLTVIELLNFFRGAGILWRGMLASLDILKADRIADRQNDPRYWVKFFDRVYEKAESNGGNVERIDGCIEQELNADLRWSELTLEQKRDDFLQLCIKAELGGGYISGIIVPDYYREFFN